MTYSAFCVFDFDIFPALKFYTNAAANKSVRAKRALPNKVAPAVNFSTPIRINGPIEKTEESFVSGVGSAGG